MQHPFCIVYILFSLLVRVRSLWAGPFAHVFENSAAETPPVVICTRVFNEGPYLHEWIEWHRMLGIQMFMIYDDGSTDDTPKILGQYEHAGVVTVMNDSNTFGGQRHVFEACREWMQQAPMNGKAWILTHDLDEFLWIDRKSDLSEVLEAKRAENIKQLHIGRLHFGSSGLACYDSRPVVKRFLHRFDAAACEEQQKQSDFGLWGAANVPIPGHVQNDICNKDGNRNGSFVQYKSISWVADVKPNAGIGPHRHPMVRERMEAGTFGGGPMVLLHYKTKSHQEFISRATGQHREKYDSGLEKTFQAQDRNDVEDRRALDYAEELEERLRKVAGPVAARRFPPCRAGGRH